MGLVTVPTDGSANNCCPLVNGGLIMLPWEVVLSGRQVVALWYFVEPRWCSNDGVRAELLGMVHRLEY